MDGTGDYRAKWNKPIQQIKGRKFSLKWMLIHNDGGLGGREEWSNFGLRRGKLEGGGCWGMKEWNERCHYAMYTYDYKNCMNLHYVTSST